jgi:RNA polymerase primary sigma factor
MADKAPRLKRSGAPAAAKKEAKPRAATGDSLNAYMREIAHFQPLPAVKEQELGRRIHAGDEAALRELVECNLRFVVSYAKRYRGLGLGFLDLIHEGTLGLIEAAKRFDPERGVKFISYAVWWVRQSIFHALSEHSRVFRLPQKMSGQVSKVEQVRNTLASELERPPTAAEVAERIGLPQKEVETLLMATGEDVSLSAAIGDGNTEFGDTLEQETIPSAELTLIKSSFNAEIQALVAELDVKERDVIRMRFGLDDEEPCTLQEIGDKLGLSRERVRQIEAKAKEKLRRSRRAQSLRGHLN